MAKAKRKFDPYKTLGVERTASTEEIKTAHRKTVKRAHPDVGGSTDSFHEAQRAYLVLSDQILRQRFDETGDVDEIKADNLTQMAMSLISNMLMQILDGEADPFQHDLIEPMRVSIKKGIGQQEAKVRKMQVAQNRAIKMRGRFKRQKGKNDMESLLEWHEKNIAKTLVELGGAVMVGKKALDILKDYEFQKDAAAPMAGWVRIATASTTT